VINKLCGCKHVADRPDDCPRVSGTSQHYLVHVVLRVDSSFRSQTHVSVRGRSYLERYRGPARQRHADIDVWTSFYREHPTYDHTNEKTNWRYRTEWRCSLTWLQKISS